MTTVQTSPLQQKGKKKRHEKLKKLLAHERGIEYKLTSSMHLLVALLAALNLVAEKSFHLMAAPG